MASAKRSKIDIENEGKVLNLRWLRNRKSFVTSERSSAEENETFPLLRLFAASGSLHKEVKARENDNRERKMLFCVRHVLETGSI